MTPDQIKQWLDEFSFRTTPLVMGVLNVTPDSFSDGGEFYRVETAVAQADRLIADGADMLDVGGESTRPGSDQVSVDEQIRRTAPVIDAIRRKHDIAISIDTTRSEVARAALNVGACMLNDVAAGKNDEAMLRLAAERDVPIVLMHMLGKPKSMQDNPEYQDVTSEVRVYLEGRVNAAIDAGVKRPLIDPGIGFGKTTAHNLTLLHNLGVLTETFEDARLLIGVSRKRFLGEITGESDPAGRDDATTATTVWAQLHGAAIIRVHNARAARHAIDVTAAITATDR